MLGISKDTVKSLPEVHYPGRVILIDSAAKAKSAVSYLLKQTQIGFDTETRPSFRKNRHYKVSLVQLSVPGECFLFRLKQIGSLDGLKSIFENPNIQKIGLSLKDDFHSLAKLCEFAPAGFVELQTFVKQYGIADNSLQKIFALIFGQRISKTQRLTNWEATELTPGQQSYAAIDAWACVEIYNYLLSGKFNPEESPYQIDDETAIMLQNSVGIHLPIMHSDEWKDSNEGVDLAVFSSLPDINSVPVKRISRKPGARTTYHRKKKESPSVDKSKIEKKTTKVVTSSRKSTVAAETKKRKPATKRKQTASKLTTEKSAQPKTQKSAVKASPEVKAKAETKAKVATRKTPKRSNKKVLEEA